MVVRGLDGRWATQHQTRTRKALLVTLNHEFGGCGGDYEEQKNNYELRMAAARCGPEISVLDPESLR